MESLEITVRDFDLAASIECGQVFGWKKINGKYVGEVKGNAVIISQEKSGRLIFDGKASYDEIVSYFRLDDDLEKIRGAISKDDAVVSSINAVPGLRLINQDAFKCAVSYICSANCNIPRIEKMLENVSVMKGGVLLQGGTFTLFSFPTPEQLSSMSKEDLLQCNLGFRAKYVKAFADAVYENGFDLNKLKPKAYEEAKAELMQFKGIGAKVADCILLFSLGKLNAFPVDVHIERIMRSKYLHLNKLNKEKIAEFGRAYFGEFAGYAQQWLYIAARKKLHNSI